MRYSIGVLVAILSVACRPAASVNLGENAPTFQLSSSAFAEGATIPVEFSCAGQDKSPELHWSAAPSEARSFALIMDDPDAPGGTFTHWVLFDIPASVSQL